MSKLRIEEFSELTSLIFSAALDPIKWTNFLNRLSVISGNIGTHLLGHDVKYGVNIGELYSGYDPDFVDSYRDYYVSKNVWVDGFFQAKVGEPVLSEWMCPTEKFVKTEFYNDWVRPQENIIGGGGALIFKESSRLLALGGNIRKRDIDRLEKPWMDLVSLLTPHLSQAFEINRTLAGKSLEIVALEDASGSQHAAIFIVDSNFQLRFLNQSAQEMFESTGLIRSDARNRISFTDGIANAVFERSIGLCSKSGNLPPVSFEITCKGSERVFECRIAEINPDRLEHLAFGDIDITRTPGVFVTISERTNALEYAARVQKLFKLTNSEVEVVLEIAKGQTPREISETREVSIHTIRNQLKSAMSKMEVRRQSDIVRILGDIG